MTIDWNTHQANLFCLLNALGYVLSLYTIPYKIRILSRDNLLRYRLFSATWATCISIVIFLAVFPAREFNLSKFNAIGLRLDNSLDSLCVTVVLMSVFYFGPLVALFQYLLISIHYEIRRDGSISPLETRRSIMSILSDWCMSFLRQYHELALFRNVVFAPLTEEIVFRAVMIPTMCLAAARSSTHTSSLAIACYSPIWFGVAHMHHFLDKMQNKVPLMSNIVSTLIQLKYTSIFGLIAALLFMRTGNLIAPITSHVICNIMGLPDTGFMHSITSNGRNEYSCMFRYRYLHLFLHAGGLVAFAYLLFPLTEYMAVQSPYWDNAYIGDTLNSSQSL